MKNKNSQELVEKLTNRQVYDNYDVNRKRRNSMIILVLFVALIVVVANRTDRKEETTKKDNKYTICKYDDCKTFSKEFIENIRYSIIDDNKIYNCGESKSNIDIVLNNCSINKQKTCSTFKDDKQYCYAFTKENVLKEDTLELVNPKEVGKLSYFSNLKSLYIEITEKNYDITKLLNDLNENTPNVKAIIYIDSISVLSDNNIDKINVNNTTDINICIGNKDECLNSGIYLKQSELVQVLSNFKTIKDDLNSKKTNLSDIDKITYLYKNIENNIKPSSLVLADHNNFSKDNYEKVLVPRTLKGVVINKTATYYGYVTYLDELCKYLGLESRIIKATNNSNNFDYAWNQIKVDGKYYNVDITLDALNIQNKKDGMEYFLLSDEEFKHQGNYTYDEKTEKVAASYNKEKITEVISSLGL